MIVNEYKTFFMGVFIIAQIYMSPPATFLVRFYISFNLIIKLTYCVIQIIVVQNIGIRLEVKSNIGPLFDPK